MDEIVAFCPACNAPVYAPRGANGCPTAESPTQFSCGCGAALLRRLRLWRARRRGLAAAAIRARGRIGG